MFNISMGNIDQTFRSIQEMENDGDAMRRALNLAVRIGTFAGAIIAVVGGILLSVSAMAAGGTFGAVAWPLVVGITIYLVCREINVFNRNAEEFWFVGGDATKMLHKMGKFVGKILKKDVANTSRWELLTLDTYLLKHLPCLV